MSISATRPHSSGGGARFVGWLSRHWLACLTFVTGVWVLLPWLAPVLMHNGMPVGAWFIYLIYSPQCHQLPQRSYFLFGEQLMLPLDQIVAITGAQDSLTLRWFIGTPALGWKVAWSDRMVSLYTPLFVGAVFYAVTGRRWSPVRWSWRLLLPYLPLLLDGGSHMLDDTLGIGVRATNDWLVVLTGGVFGYGFYAGDAVGSFNWWMRLITGLVAGFAFVRQVYPHLERGFAAMARANR